MKQDKHRFLRKRPGRKPGKAGSSLALVMMIGAALVIWVMCIMPLMTTTGTTAIQTEEKYDDYLESRSSIEYCKSELERMVNIDKKVPSTFAVVKNVAADTYTAYEKIAGRTDGYYLYVDAKVKDTDDSPLMTSENGKLVTAICAVVPDDDDPGVYNITIQTYHSGEKGQVYKLKYTLSGSLLIYPESYNQNQALPLSDFVLVDGKLGDNEVWVSDIGGPGDTEFQEWLKPATVDTDDPEYANAQEYPAVFKKTAEAAIDNNTPISKNVIKEDPVTSETWIEPHPVEAAKKSAPGDMWIATDSNDYIQVLVLDANEKETDVTTDCNIYVNGKESATVPGEKGTYGVTVDYKGTDLNILPASGLRMLNTVGKTDFQQQTLNETCSIKSVEKTGDTYTVTLTAGASDLLYGYCTSPDSETCTWRSSPTFTELDGGNTYYFYYCRPAGVDNNGVYHTDSDIQYAGMIFPKAFTNSLTEGQYLMLGLDGGKYYAMESNLSTKELPVQSDFFVCNGSLAEYSNELAWTARGSGDQWDFQNGKYLYMYGEIKYSSIFNATIIPYLQTIASPNGSFTVNPSNGSSTNVWRNVSAETWWGEPKDGKGYLNISNSKATATTDSKSTVYFLNAPASAPNPDSIAKPTPTYETSDFTANFNAAGTNIPNVEITSAIKRAFSKEYEVDFKPENLYVNGKLINNANTPDKPLPVGAYYLTADITVTDEDGNTCYYCVALGNLIVEQAEQKIMLTVGADITGRGEDERYDEKKVTVSVTFGDSTASSATVPDGNLWIGYKLIQNADETKPENSVYHWFPATGNSYNFRLEYGTYLFAARKWGNSNYACAQSTDAEFEVVMQWVDLTGDNIGSEFEPLYISTKEEGPDNPQWYNLPEKILPSRVNLWFGVTQSINDDPQWFDTYDDAVAYQQSLSGNVNPGLLKGVKVQKTNYESIVLRIASGNDYESVNGHALSMMKGESLYFMGEDYSIKTYGNAIYLTTDLLVMKNGITGGTVNGTACDIGHVIVNPYDGEDILFFNANKNPIKLGTYTVAGRTFYKIKANTDLCSTGSSDIVEVGTLNETDTRRKDIQDLFRKKVYPEINLDIAYADKDQLSRIVSGETIGWTNDGVLSGNSDSANAGYAVCAYVSEISGSVSRKANRVLLAARTKETTPAGNEVYAYTLKVPGDLTFTTRYLSIDADEVRQGSSGVKFTIKNLGQDSDFLTNVLNIIFSTNSYQSKTLQVEYERSTKIMDYSGNTIAFKENSNPVGPAICRYENDRDLFTAEAQSLMVPYTTAELEGMLQKDTTIQAKTVDRYVTISCDDGSKSLSKSRNGVGFELNMFANYIYIDSTVERINLSAAGSIFGATHEADFRINSQESGYTAYEYLGLFTTHSAESYAGTLVYVKNNLPISCNVSTGDWWNPYSKKQGTIEAGFYFIPATEDGISLTELRNGVVSPTPVEGKPYKVGLESLKNFSVVINTDGSLSSNAFVDPGIYDNTSTGLGGFSGGNVG